MRTARIILFFPLALIRLLSVLAVSAFVVMVGMVWLRFFGFSRRLQNWAMQTWGKSILWVCGVKVKKNESPIDSHFILMPNHRSYLDIFIVAAYTSAGFVAKAELKNWPLMKQGAKINNTIFVERDELHSLLSTMNKIRQAIENGISVVLFPEGTSYMGPLTKPFKKGSFKIAADSGIPVIPMAIHYRDNNDAWVGNDTFIGHFFRQMCKPVTHVTIRYGKPLIHSDYQILLSETREQIDEMLKEIIEVTK
jgi:1-acyl-sn-glycerol-3-phosphate acyltransferase